MPWWVQVYFDISQAISEKSVFDTDQINKYFPENPSLTISMNNYRKSVASMLYPQ